MNRRRLLGIGAALLTVVCAAPSLAQLLPPLSAPAPSLISSLTLSAASVTGGSPATGTVTLNLPAPAGGAQVTLSSSNPAVAAPASVTVSPGGTSATFSLSTSAVAASTPVTISASGSATQTASLTVVPPSVSSLSLSAANVTGGTTAAGTVTLNGPAPAGGAQVTLLSSDPAAAVPASVTVSPEGTSATFGLTTGAVAASTPVTISASDGGGTQTASLTVLPSIVEAKIDPALLALMQATPGALLPVIVEMQHPFPPFVVGGAKNVGRALEALELLCRSDPVPIPPCAIPGAGIPVAALSLIDAAAGFANAERISALSLLPTVAFIHHDRTVGPPQSVAQPPTTPPDQASTDYPRVVKAPRVWRRGRAGNGVTVAVLDSGVEPDLDLVAPTNRILASVNFADQRRPTDPKCPNNGSNDLNDPGGHGTHVAGIVAGNGSRSDGEFVGIAPHANIVDVRVLGCTGSGRISSVVRGIEWVLAQDRTVYNIRVINLSFGARNPLSYRADPLSAAVEIAWRRGLVVVAAAGNTGPERDTVVSPGIDPYVITVGATDDHGTRKRDDDTLAWFSAWGSADSNPKPDLVAPGRRLVSVHVPGSTLDWLNTRRLPDVPTRIVVAQNGSTYFRLSGTSMATGVVSGAAALLLQHRPNLTPNQVKALLVGTTQPYGWESGQVLPDPIADGSGLLNAFAAIKAARDMEPDDDPCVPTGLSLGALLPGALLPCPPPSADEPVPVNNALRPADGFARAMYPVLYGNLSVLYKDGSPVLWESVIWDSIAWDSIAWDNIDWDSVAWGSIAWDSTDWTEQHSIAWDSVAWDSVAWDADNTPD